MRRGKLSIFLPGCAAVLLLGVFGSQTANAAPITVPTGLNPGDQYRLAFVTSTRGGSALPDIAAYNALVTVVANSVPELVALGATWRVIGSTLTVDARDNTGTNPFVNGVGVPIYQLNDTLLASDNADLWDGSIAVFFEVAENGIFSTDLLQWTGTQGDGRASSSSPLGCLDELVTFGRQDTTGFGWIASDVARCDLVVEAAYYAMSSTLTVPPPPAVPLLSTWGLLMMTALLGVLCLGSVGLAARRRFAKTH